MYVRVVRFTDVSPEHIRATQARIKESGGPPEGVRTTGLQVYYDESQGTAVVVQQFASAEDMEAAARVLSAMDAADTPGTRASVDTCELMLDLKP